MYLEKLSDCNCGMSDFIIDNNIKSIIKSELAMGNTDTSEVIATLSRILALPKYYRIVNELNVGKTYSQIMSSSTYSNLLNDLFKTAANNLSEPEKVYSPETSNKMRLTNNRVMQEVFKILVDNKTWDKYESIPTTDSKIVTTDNKLTTTDTLLSNIPEWALYVGGGLLAYLTYRIIK